MNKLPEDFLEKENAIYIERKKKMKVRKIEPSKTLALSFFLLIFAGGLLLALPIASQSGKSIGLLSAMFTATSAVCVTGLTVVEPGITFTVFGKIVLILLIQFGGLGFMTIATLGAVLIGKRISLRERLLIQESLGQYNMSGIVKLARNIFIGTVVVEAIGAFFLSFSFVPKYGWILGIFHGIWHSISAFCNAGFDILGTGGFISVNDYVTDPIVNFTIMGLIVVGGLGFTVFADVWRNRRWVRCSLHTKLVLLTTGLLIAGGAIGFFIFEQNNTETIGCLTLSQQWMASLFQSITPRTAGYATLDQMKLTEPSKLLTIILMFIGGSPASTAGGIKTTTFALLLLTSMTFIKNKRDVEVFQRRISYTSVNKALTVATLSLLVAIIATIFITVLQPEITLTRILFEVVSALGTVGLTLNLTADLQAASLMILMIVMFLGRVGTLTIIIAFSIGHTGPKHTWPEDKIII